MRRTGRIVHALAGALTLLEIATPGREQPAPLLEDERYGSCAELVLRLEEGAFFDDHYYDPWGQVLIASGTEEAYRLTEVDAACISASEAVSRLVRSDVENHRQNQTSECHGLRDLDVGIDDQRPEVRVNVDALVRYRDKVCAGPGPSLLLGE